MNDKLYYTAPSDEIFNEVKEKAIELWREIADHEGYLNEKIGRIKDLKNISDNVMYIVAMFDPVNAGKLAYKLSPEARKAIADRLASTGEVIYFSRFNQ